MKNKTNKPTKLAVNILIACEFSGRVRDAFRERGHDAWSCDILPSNELEHHIQGDVIHLLSENWDLLIAHPPCTYLSNSGVLWLHRDQTRWEKMKKGAEFFKKLMDCKIPKIAIENPIMHKYSIEIIGRRQDQTIQPYQFGCMEQKRTCLWLKGLPKLKETKNVKVEMDKLPKKDRQRLHYMSPSKDRGKLRSITYQGIADAMAEQWG